MEWKRSLRVVSKKKLYWLYDKRKLFFFMFCALETAVFLIATNRFSSQTDRPIENQHMYGVYELP